MPAFSAALSQWFLGHHGIIDSANLARLGVSRHQRERMLGDGVLESLFEGVYHLVAAPLTFEARCAAVCMADVSLVVSCCSAGRLWWLRKCLVPDIHVTTARTTKPVGEGVVVHRTSELADIDIITRPDGIRVTSPPRTFFDIAKHVDDLALESIGEQIIDRGLCGLRTLLLASKRLSRPGRAGSARALRVLSGRPEFRAAADSHDELVLFKALHAVGMTDLVTQPAVTLPSGKVVHPDLGVPSIGFYVEVDHHTWHDTRAAANYDKSRDRKVRLTGAVVERVTDTHIRTRLAEVVADLVTLCDQRRSSLSFGDQIRAEGL